MWWDKPNPNKKPAEEREPLPFMKWRLLGFLVSILILVATTVSLVTQGLNMGLDFTGGVQIEAARATVFDPEVVRGQIRAWGFPESTVTTADNGAAVLIRLPAQGDIDAVTRRVTEALGEGVTIRGAAAASGGVQIEAARVTVFDPEVVRGQIRAAGFPESTVTTADNGATVLIRLPVQEGDIDAVARRVTDALGEGVTIRGAAAVSGKVSNELFQGGIIACLLALAAIALYIWFRFELKFGWAALITTFHDVYAILGLFSIFKQFLVFDLTIVAGVLTLAGYSINDKVVVFDRIREMLKKYKKIPLPRIIDISITATLSRTLITSLATMMAGGAMLFLGGSVLFGFAVSICFGIVIGTYSSIFVAAPLLIHLPGRVPGQRVEKGEEVAAGAAS